ncbi:MAG: DUF1441 family protein [Deltaproteobacteria bacterium]|nr:DUF1441 family protein [Deltaproteobacteria bacterium]
MVTFADLERISGMTFRTIRERLKQVTPASSSGKSDFYRLTDALPALYRSDKSEKEQVTIEEIRARTRNWHVTADRSEIKREQEAGKLYQVEDVHRVLDRMLMAFKNRLESLPSRLAAIDSGDYFLRMEQAEKIVDDALLEINQDAIRQCRETDSGESRLSGEADSPAISQ